MELKEKFGYLSTLSFDGNGHRLINSRWFEKILQRKVVENGVRKKTPTSQYFPRNARDTICAFKFASSRQAFDLHTFLRLTRALCRSLVVERSVARL